MGCASSKPSFEEPSSVEPSNVETSSKPSSVEPSPKPSSALAKYKDPIALKPMKQDTVYDAVVEGMVKKDDIASELQNQKMIQHAEQRKCSKCKGTGKLYRRQRTLLIENFDLTARKSIDLNGPQIEEEGISESGKETGIVISKEEEVCYVCSGSGQTSE